MLMPVFMIHNNQPVFSFRILFSRSQSKPLHNEISQFYGTLHGHQYIRGTGDVNTIVLCRSLCSVHPDELSNVDRLTF